MSEQTTSTDAETEAAPRPDYGADYYAHYWGGGGPYERNEQWLQFFGTVADGLIRDFHPTSVLDAGCAMGFLVEQLSKRGVEADGFDVSDFAISEVDESVADRCRVASLTEPIGRRYDLITCIEVLEHLPPEEADAAVANLCAASDLIVMSSTPADYGEPTHLNVLQPEDWAVKFAQNGFFRDLDRDLSYLSRWTAVYVRREERQDETVRRYDRSWMRLRREIGEVRESLIATQNALDEERRREREFNEKVRSNAEFSELQAKIDSQEREILRLRDTLVGKELELGSAKGELAVIEDREQRIIALQARLSGKIPGAGRLLNLMLRLARGR